MLMAEEATEEEVMVEVMDNNMAEAVDSHMDSSMAEVVDSHMDSSMAEVVDSSSLHLPRHIWQ